MWIILSILITIFSKWDTFHVIKVQISKLFMHKIVIIFSHESLNINESTHEISNNVVCATNKGSDQPADIPIKSPISLQAVQTRSVALESEYSSNKQRL